MKTREKFQPVTDGRNEIFEVFRKKQGDLDIIGVERQGLIYYIILLGGFNSHKAWVSIMMDGEVKSILDGLLDTSIGTIEVLAQKCPLLSQSILDGLDKRFNNGAFINVAGDWFFNRDFWFSMDTEAWVNLSTEVCFELIERCTQMLNEFSNFKGFSFSEKAKISAKDVYRGYKKIRPYIAIAKIAIPH